MASLRCWCLCLGDFKNLLIIVKVVVRGDCGVLLLNLLFNCIDDGDFVIIIFSCFGDIFLIGFGDGVSYSSNSIFLFEFIDCVFYLLLFIVVLMFFLLFLYLFFLFI